MRVQQGNPYHPHQAAVHLLKSLNGCKNCNPPIPQTDLLQLQQLQYRKNLLVQQLNALTLKNQSLPKLKAQIVQLQQLVGQLRAQNQHVQQAGVHQIGRLSAQREHYQLEQRSHLIEELTVEKSLNNQLDLQLQSLMERIRYLNRANNELIYSFSSQ